MVKATLQLVLLLINLPQGIKQQDYFISNNKYRHRAAVRKSPVFYGAFFSNNDNIMILQNVYGCYFASKWSIVVMQSNCIVAVNDNGGG